MNRNSFLHTGLLLAVCAAALNTNIALADDLAADEARTTNATIVLADASALTSKTSKQTDAIRDEVAEALEGILADGKLELDLRLSNHRSEFLAANL